MSGVLHTEIFDGGKEKKFFFQDVKNKLNERGLNFMEVKRNCKY